jgi:FtsH-binding integral membrane protein
MAQPGTLVRSGAERATLVRRTYTLVLASVAVTIFGVGFGLTQPQMMQAVILHPWITMLCVFAPLMLAQMNAKTFPLNIGFVALFTFAEGLWLAPFIAFMESRSPGIAAQAGALTFGAFSVLTVYAWISRRDFRPMGAFLVVGMFVLMGAMILNIFMQSNAADTWIAAVGVLIFSGMLVFDTWRIRNTFGPDDYVMAAVQIYLDLLNMFLFILRLLGGGRRN